MRRFFRRDAVAQRVLATATCLAGWLAVTAGIVSKRPGAPAGFQARVGKIRREARKNFFRLPTLVFSLPTLPYVTVAHPANRTEADLREKASLATNQVLIDQVSIKCVSVMS